MSGIGIPIQKFTAMMPIDGLRTKPLVSVVIPCYNQGRFLSEAIASVQKQSYPNLEIIVVDDGSADNTRQVATASVNVKYYYQSNTGLSGARNTGVKKSKGFFLVFLDADDVLYPDAVRTNLNYLLQNPSWAFVSGGHDKVDEWLDPVEDADETTLVTDHYYEALLRGNYIGMHATVMYRCHVFDEFKFDTSLTACEDYDLYFNIARKYPVGSHPEKVAAYRHHDENMSADYMKMLKHVLLVLGRQKDRLKNAQEKEAWHAGIRVWQHHYATLLYRQLFNSIERDKRWPGTDEMKLMARVMPARFRDYVVKKTRNNFLSALKNALPDKVLKWLHQAGVYNQYTPPPGKIQPGDFNRLTPFSSDFGFDRGGAVDRFYIETFLEKNQQYVRGRVLEIGDNAYTLRFGGARVLHSDILHIDSQDKRATYIGDITDVPQIPSAAFDCIIFTQTLHLIYDFTSALKTCYRILKPGGCLLLTVPGISHIDKGAWRAYWLWSFTDASIKKLLAETFNGSAVDIKTYGNVYAAAAFLYGMGLPECRKDFLFHHDPSYQVIISATAIKY
jgi:glycosyltransferase involved in cell wall biosynthesis